MTASSIETYINSLNESQQSTVEKIRSLILKNLPEGYEEHFSYGMMAYVVPLSMFPQGYLGKKDQPLPYIMFGAKKNYYSLHMMNMYLDPKNRKWLESKYAKTDKKLDMGKGCLKFKSMEDIPLEVIKKAIGLVSTSKYIDLYNDVMSKRKK